MFILKVFCEGLVVLVVLVMVLVVLVVAFLVLVVASHYDDKESHHQGHQNTLRDRN